MNKGMKTETLRHWFGIDSILFGKPASKVIKEKEDFDKYLTAKGAFLSNLFEIYKKVNFDSDLSFNTVSEMKESAQELAKIAKSRATKLLEKKPILNMVREEITEIGNSENLDENLVTRYVVQKRRNAVALDSMIFESILTKNRKRLLEDWKGKILLNASKTLRDSMIDLALR